MKYLLLSITFILWTLQSFAQKDTLNSTKPFGFGLMKSYYADHSPNLVNKSIRKKWIMSAISELKNIISSDSIEISYPQITDIPDFKKVSYKVNDCRKLLFSDNTFLLICLHSAHENPQIGDVSIAIDNKNKVYVNYGHVCGGIIHFENLSLSVPACVKYFIKNFVSDTDDKKWMKW